MARAGGVAVESSNADEIVLRVRAPGKVVPVTSVLYPTGNEWECDCPSRMSPCEHVAAAAIALSAGERPAEAAGMRAAIGIGDGVGGRRNRRADGTGPPAI